MKQSFQLIQDCFRDYFGKERRQLLLLAAVVCLSYGFMSCYITFNNDLAFFFRELWTLGFQVGRWGYGLLSLIGFTNIHLPFWNACIGMTAFYFAVILWAMFFYEASYRRISREALLFFMLLFASCPLNYEQFLYPAALTLHAFGFGLMILGSFLLVRQNVTRKDYCCSAFVLGWSFAIYESYVFVYLLTGLFFMVVRFAYSEDRTDWSYWRHIRKILILFFLASLIFAAGALVTPHIFGYQEGANRGICWLDPTLNPLVTFCKMCWHVGYDYFYNGLFYFTILMFVLSLPMWGHFCWKLPVPKWLRLAAIAFCPGIVFALSLLTGRTMLYRSGQTAVIATAVCWMLFWDRTMRKYWWRWILMFFIIFWQTKEINLWAFYDYRASEKNMADIKKIGYDIKEQFGREPVKPLVFCSEGFFERSLPFIKTMPMQLFDRFPRYCFVNLHAGRAYFGQDTYQFYELFQNFTGLKAERNLERSRYYQQVIQKQHLPAWPQKGYITEQKECILINLGTPPYNANIVMEPSEYLSRLLKIRR